MLWSWLGDNRESLAVVLSTLALIISLATFLRSWIKDRRDLAKHKLEKIPVFTLKTSNAREGDMYVEGRAQRAVGWSFDNKIEIENRFGVPCTLEKISGKSSKGKVKIFEVSYESGLKVDLNNGSLFADRAGNWFKHMKAGGKLRFSFKLYIYGNIPAAEVEAGMPMDISFNFQIQEKTPVTQIVDRHFVLQPSRVTGIDQQNRF